MIGVLDGGDVAALGVHEIPGGSGIDGVVQVHGCDGSLDDLTVANEIVTAFGQHQVQAAHRGQVDDPQQGHDTFELRHGEQHTSQA